MRRAMVARSNIALNFPRNRGKKMAISGWTSKAIDVIENHDYLASSSPEDHEIAEILDELTEFLGTSTRNEWKTSWDFSKTVGLIINLNPFDSRNPFEYYDYAREMKFSLPGKKSSVYQEHDTDFIIRKIENNIRKYAKFYGWQ
jgi:hypothetical protein